MKKRKNLSQLQQNISENLLESIRLVEILDELNDGEAKRDILINMLHKKICSAFNNTSKCRRMIAFIE